MSEPRAEQGQHFWTGISDSRLTREEQAVWCACGHEATGMMFVDAVNALIRHCVDADALYEPRANPIDRAKQSMSSRDRTDAPEETE